MVEKVLQESQVLEVPVEITKSQIELISKEIKNSENSLKNYILIKGLEKICKNITDDKDFRIKVKDDFLKHTEGVVDKEHLYGATINTVKPRIEFDKYTYSKDVEQMEKDVEVLASELELKKDALKMRKRAEITAEVAKEITPESVLGIEVAKAENAVLKEFDIQIKFE